METAEVSKNIHGDQTYQKRAQIILPILVRQAKARQKISYQDLAKEVGIHHRVLNYPLGAIGTSLQELSDELGKDVPQIQSIVVRKNTGLPGDGIAPFLGREKEFRKMSSQKKNDLVNEILKDVFQFEQWDDVLYKLGLKPLKLSRLQSKKLKNASGKYGSGGGESEDHKKLKKFVKQHPEIIGINTSDYNVITEHYLPSGDSIDVFFKTTNLWIGVEVKSKISSELDILRGLFQCVKYEAVLKAELKVKGEIRDVHVYLVMENEFPIELQSELNTLGIVVLDRVRHL